MGVAAICAEWAAVAVAAARATNASSSFASTSKNILSLDWRAFLSCSSPWRRPSPTWAGRGAGGEGGDGVGVKRLCMVSVAGGGGTHPSGMGAGGRGFGVARVGEGALGIAGAENSEMKNRQRFRHHSRLAIYCGSPYIVDHYLLWITVYCGSLFIIRIDMRADSNTDAC